MPREVNFYEILGISKQATKDEIKRAYRKVAMKFHPDHAGSNYEEVFRKIKEAHDTLIDDYKRKMYDKFGFSGKSNIELQNEAYNLIRNILLDVISKQGEKIFYLDIISFVKEHCSKKIKMLEEEINNLVKKKNYLEKLQGRFSWKTSPNNRNMIVQMFMEEKASIDTQIWSKLANIQTLERAGSAIQDYNFNFDRKIEETDSQ